MFKKRKMEEDFMEKVVEFLQENPQIEISVSSPTYAWIRLHGKAVFEDNMHKLGWIRRSQSADFPVKILLLFP